MAKYIIKRILAAIPMVLIITVICFALMNLAPYDAIDAMTTPNMSPETVALIKAKYGYDQPVYIQYIRWLDGLINGNFGYSIVTHQSISADLAIRIPNTIKLILPAYLLAYALAIVLGDTKALPLMIELMKYGYEHCDVVILEGIMYDEWYRALLKTATELYGMNVYA